MAVVPPIIPIAVIAKRNRILRRFNDAAAHSPETARSLEDLRVKHGHMVRRMIRNGVIKEAPGGRFWLDEQANTAFRRRAGVAVAIVLGIAAVVIGIVLVTR